jgi:hypothetical protein
MRIIFGLPAKNILQLTPGSLYPGRLGFYGLRSGGRLSRLAFFFQGGQLDDARRGWFSGYRPGFSN